MKYCNAIGLLHIDNILANVSSYRGSRRRRVFRDVAVLQGLERQQRWRHPLDAVVEHAAALQGQRAGVAVDAQCVRLHQPELQLLYLQAGIRASDHNKLVIHQVAPEKKPSCGSMTVVLKL